MKFQVYFLLGTSLSCFPALAFGQCVTAQDCAALGYTESSCPGKGLKCPFGSGWFCVGDEDAVCAENGFKYTCTGTGYSGGIGDTCGGKYAQCTCASGYEWKDGTCKKKEILNGAQGDLYYCNGTVVAVKASGMDFYVEMEDLGSMRGSSANSSCPNYSFCSNLKGTLPTKDQIVIMYNNKSSLNNLLSTNGGTKLTENWYWSSTDYTKYGSSGYYYYIVNMSHGSVDYNNAYNFGYVRCILTSW